MIAVAVPEMEKVTCYNRPCGYSYNSYRAGAHIFNSSIEEV